MGALYNIYTWNLDLQFEIAIVPRAFRMQAHNTNAYIYDTFICITFIHQAQLAPPKSTALPTSSEDLVRFSPTRLLLTGHPPSNGFPLQDGRSLRTTVGIGLW